MLDPSVQKTGRSIEGAWALFGTVDQEIVVEILPSLHFRVSISPPMILLCVFWFYGGLTPACPADTIWLSASGQGGTA